MPTTRQLFTVSLVWLLSVPSSSAAQSTQTSAQTTAPQPAVVLQQSLGALVGNTTLSDITLTGAVHRIAGSDDETGSATLMALSSGSARSDLALSSGTISEIYSFTGSGPAGAWSGADGELHAIPFHNVLCEPAWFFPALVISRQLSAGAIVTDLGPVIRNGRQVEHLSVSQNPPYPLPATGVSYQHLTQLDFFIDSQTLLPASMSYNIHPDINAGKDIPVEVDFSDYRSASGVQAPFHVQKFVNSTLLLDIQLQNININSGISASAFTIQ